MHTDTVLLTWNRWARALAALVVLTAVTGVRATEAEGYGHSFQFPWHDPVHAGIDVRLHSALLTYTAGEVISELCPSADADWVRLPGVTFRDPGVRL